MHYNDEILSNEIKNARSNSGLTVEQVAEKTGITERYIYRIENEQRKPSFDVLFKLVRALNISPEKIFYPEKIYNESDLDDIIHNLYKCNDKSIAIIRAVIHTVLDNQ